MGREEFLLACFPQMAELKITSPPTGNYNCIAWAFGDNRRWWWPDPFSFWPLPPEDTVLRAFEVLLERLRAQPTTSQQTEIGYGKIALFAKQGSPTHAARLLPNGLWTSKLGKEEDVAHKLREIEGETYGRLAQIFKIPVGAE